MNKIISVKFIAAFSKKVFQQFSDIRQCRQQISEPSRLDQTSVYHFILMVTSASVCLFVAVGFFFGGEGGLKVE